ncbi:head GIN domain-containing protein [Flavobacterium sp. HNIBRBA15423]|uniref:head GIN domain-containing protein n=1 Tax=Flavobacterium sp. HNIBRBA15423 TaxID=3458683 RepID=UPI004044DEA0
MIKIIVTLAAFLISIISLAQVSENREVANFSKLNVSTGITVLYTISDSKSIQIETDSREKLQYVKTEVEGETLKLYVNTDSEKNTNKKLKKRGWNNGVNFKVLKIIVSGPNLKEIKANSSADVTIKNTNSSTNLNIEISSSGSISGNFNCLNLFIDASSSGEFSGKINATSIDLESSSSSDVILSGKATRIVIQASSSSSCNLKDFNVETAIIRASSSANVILTVSKSLTVKATSSATVDYYGNPLQISKEESSSGSVTKK